MGRRLRKQELTPDLSFLHYGRIIARLSLLMRNSDQEVAFRMALYILLKINIQAMGVLGATAADFSTFGHALRSRTVARPAAGPAQPCIAQRRGETAAGASESLSLL